MSARRERIRRRHQRRGGGRVLALTFGVLTAFAAIGVLGAVGYVVSVANDAPDIARSSPSRQGAISPSTPPTASALGFITSDTLRSPVNARLSHRR